VESSCEFGIEPSGSMNCWETVDWIGLAQDRDRWRTLVNSVLNPRVP
jgi:hypothetical protein